MNDIQQIRWISLVEMSRPTKAELEEQMAALQARMAQAEAQREAERAKAREEHRKALVSVVRRRRSR